MNVTRVILAHQTRYPDLNAWEFEGQLDLHVGWGLAVDAQEAWNEYLKTDEHEVFVERLRQVFSEEHRQRIKDQLLELWSGE